MPAVSPPPTPAGGADATTIVRVDGPDRPGVTARVLGALAGAEILDVDQVVLHGHVVLVARVAAGHQQPALVDALTRAGHELGLRVSTEPGPAGPPAQPRDRLVVTLLGAPLGAQAMAATVTLLAAHGARVGRVRTLSTTPVTTVELSVSGGDTAVLRPLLAAEATRHGVDVAVSRAGLARRGRRLVVLDVDSTLITAEVIELLAEHAGRREEVAAVTRRAMRGELDFAQSLHQRTACLAGLPVSVLDEVRAAVRLTPGARTLCRTLHHLGFTVGLVSGGFAEVVEPIARELGIDHVRANRLEIVDDRLTGRVLGDVVDRAGKAAALTEFAAAEGLPLARTVAVGDGANDVDMLVAAGMGIAFNAAPVVREHADATLSVPHLDAVLYLMGISRQEIEEAERLAEPGAAPAVTDASPF